MVYKRIRVDITEKQVLQALKGKQIRIAASQINTGDTFVSLHPLNAKKIENAFLKKKGTTLFLSHGELLETASNMEGAGFWNTVLKTLKSGWSALRKSGVLTAAADAAVAPLSAVSGQPALVNAGRQLLKQTTGVGVRMKKADKYEMLKGAGIYLS